MSLTWGDLAAECKNIQLYEDKTMKTILSEVMRACDDEVDTLWLGSEHIHTEIKQIQLKMFFFCNYLT